METDNSMVKAGAGPGLEGGKGGKVGDVCNTANNKKVFSQQVMKKWQNRIISTDNKVSSAAKIIKRE